MSGNIINFSGRHSGHINSELTAEVAYIRSSMKVEYDRNFVIDEPLLNNQYRPFVLTNGSIRLAADGLTDFEETFGWINGIQTPTLLVVYEAVKHALERRIKEDDEDYHKAFGRLALRSRHQGLYSPEGDVHVLENRLIGFTARYIASLRAARNIKQRAARERAPAQIASSASDAMRKSGVNTVRRTVMADFSQMLPESLTLSVMKLIRKQV